MSTQVLANPVRESSERINKLWEKHHQQCCGTDISKKERGLDAEWIYANCRSVDIKEATELLGYPAKSGGIAIEGSNGQFQLRPDKPWSNKPGQKAPKYRTAKGDEYTALLPKHPTDKHFWTNLEALKERCYKIGGRRRDSAEGRRFFSDRDSNSTERRQTKEVELLDLRSGEESDLTPSDITPRTSAFDDGHPMLVVTEGGFKAIALCSHGIPAIALLGVEMGLTPAKDDPQGKRYLVPDLERFAREGFGFILAFDADTYSKKPVKQALIKLASQLKKFQV